MNIDKELFVNIIDELDRSDRYKTDLNNFFKSHGVDGYIFQPDCAISVVSLLHNACGKADDDGLISKFCFEYNYGRKWKEEDTEKYHMDLSDSGKLYDHLVSLC